jgi:hypothetical protein
VVVAGDAGHAEGRTTWLLVGVIMLVFLAAPVWSLVVGSAHGSVPSTPATPVATLAAGQTRVFAPGDLVVGDGLSCESRGLAVGAWVPKPGHTTRSQLHSASGTWTVSIEIRTRDDSTVIVRCS